MSEFKLKLLSIALVLFLWGFATDANVRARQFNKAGQIDSSINTQSDEISLHRLRFTWGGGESKAWTGAIKFLGAEILNPEVLGFSRDSASFAKFQKNQVIIRQAAPSTFEGFDVDVLGPPDSKIVVEVTEQGGEPVRREFAVSKISVQDQVFVIDQQGNRLSIARSAQDFIQFRSDRRHMVFEPGEDFEFEFRAWQLRQKNQNSVCSIDVRTARQNKLCATSTATQLQFDHLNSTPFVAHKISVPNQEGVYNLRLQIASASTDALRFTRRQESIVREIQFVVIDPNRRHTSTAQKRLIKEIGPDDMRSSIVPQQLNHFSRMVGIRNSNTSPGNFLIDREQKSVTLPVGGWQAIPISIGDTANQCVVEIDYPAGHEMALGCSILQTDANGQVPNFGAESGLKIPSSVGSINHTQESSTHRFAFWPEKERVFLLLANRDQKSECQYQRIRVYSVLQRRGQDTPKSNVGKRKQMVFYEQPLFAENFSSHQHHDQQFGQSITDWQTFLTGVRRTAGYLRENGASGAFINVFGEGSALTPLDTVSSSPRYDSGAFSSYGHDPVRKDVVELIYRVFDAEGLVFVPVMTFDHRMAGIEFGNASGYQLINNRQEVVDTESADTLPVYNPLDSAVQQTVNQTIAEFASRYRSKPSYKGIAVICRPDTYTLLPGSNMAGYDKTTLQEFWKWKTQSNRYAEKHVADVFRSENYSDWLQWRSLQMSNWYRQMARIVAPERSGAKLYLAFVDLFRNEEIASVLSPSLHRSADIGQAMTRLGLDPNLGSESDEIVLMQPGRFAPMHALVSKKSETVANANSAVSNWFASGRYPTNLFMQRSAWARFEKLEGSGYFSKQEQPLLRLQQLSLGAFWNRERFARALLDSDSRMLVDGGILLNTALDDGLKEFAEVFSSLPDKPFTDVSHRRLKDQRHPVAVRFYRQGSNIFVYCVNASPWASTVNFDFLGDANWLSQIEMLGHTNSESIIRNSDQSMQTEVPAFGLVGFRCDNSSLRITGFDYSFPQEAHNELKDSYYRLRSRLIASGNAKDIGVLNNPGFELGAQTGWNSGVPEGSKVAAKNINAYQGKTCLKIDNVGRSSLWVRSNSFAPPVTGRLSISVWMRTDDQSNQPPLRISVESNDPNSSYYRFAELGSLVADKRLNQVTTNWKRYAVHFDDLPQESVSSMRIGFDMMGPGQVLIDEVQVYDRWLDEKDLKAMTQIFASVGPMMKQQEKLEQCRQILNSYWPQFLKEYFDENSTAISENVQSDPNAISESSQNKNMIRSSMRKRFRRFVSPGIFQFR